MSSDADACAGSGRRAAALYWSARRLPALVDAASEVVRGAFNGLWLGVLRREAIHRVDQLYYDQQELYRSPGHNLSGLFEWEERALERNFAGARVVAVLGAGAGREVLALRARGLEVDGYECHPDLRDSGSRILAEQGFPGPLAPMDRDLCPPLERRYDGLVIGWTAYMLIQGRSTRIRLLANLRSAVASGIPLLLSFYTRAGRERHLRVAFRVARAIRRLLRRPPAEMGDTLRPNFVHYFTRAELEGELAEGGWNLLSFADWPNPHAVAVAATPPTHADQPGS